MRVEPLSPATRINAASPAGSATLRDPGRSPIDVTLADLTATGALLETPDTLPQGTLVTLGIAGAGVQLARIVGSTPGALIAQFVQPLDPRQVRQARAVPELTTVAVPQLPIDRVAARDAAMPATSAALSASFPDRLTYDPARLRLAVASRPDKEAEAAAVRLALQAGHGASGADAAPAPFTWLIFAALCVAGLVYLLI